VLTLADLEGRVFDGEDVRLVNACADQAALALERARLHDEARRRQREG
jgi:GAF domain-containing protein